MTFEVRLVVALSMLAQCLAAGENEGPIVQLHLILNIDAGLPARLVLMPGELDVRAASYTGLR